MARLHQGRHACCDRFLAEIIGSAQAVDSAGLASRAQVARN